MFVLSDKVLQLSLLDSILEVHGSGLPSEIGVLWTWM
jgi:hypothetical protein